MDLMAISENDDGTAAITIFAPRFIREMAEGILMQRGLKKPYLASIDDEELRGLLSSAEESALISVLLGHEQQKNSRKNLRRIERSDLPKDRDFRNAWCPCPEKKITVDMNKAKEIHMGKIRKARDVELKKLDIETLKGKDVQSQKQVLRDLPQTFDLSQATTPDELKALWPKELNVE